MGGGWVACLFLSSDVKQKSLHWEWECATVFLCVCVYVHVRAQ